MLEETGSTGYCTRRILAYGAAATRTVPQQGLELMLTKQRLEVRKKADPA